MVRWLRSAVDDVARRAMDTRIRGVIEDATMTGLARLLDGGWTSTSRGVR